MAKKIVSVAAPAKGAFASKVGTAYGSVDLAGLAHHGTDVDLSKYGETFTIDLSEAIPVQALNPRQNFGNPLADYNARWESTGPNDGKWVDDAENLKTGCTRYLRAGWNFGEKPAGVLVIGNNDALRQLAFEHLDAWIETIEASNPALGAFYKAFYGDRSRVKYVIVKRQRYTHAAPAALHWRNTQPGAVHTLELPISATLMHADSLRDLLLEALQENLNAGQVLMTPVDMLQLAKRLYLLDRSGFSQNLLLRNNFKKGEAQRVANIIKLDDTFPSLRIVERMAMPQPKEGEAIEPSNDCPLPLSKFSHSMVTSVAQGQLPETKGEPIPGGLTKAWLAKWLIGVATNGRVKSVSITDVQEKAGGHACLLLQDLVKAIKANTLVDFLTSLTGRESMLDAVNACYSMRVESDEAKQLLRNYVEDIKVVAVEVSDKSVKTGE